VQENNVTKAVILAGGLGTRISEETSVRPKPMIEIGGKPILWHILKIYSHYGINDFVICLGYKGYVIKEFFANYFLHTSDVTFHMDQNRMEVLGSETEPWRVTLVDTGDETQTGGRLKRASKYLGSDDPFCLTYGDGVADIDIAKTLEFHRSHGKLATMSAVLPTARWGAIEMDGDTIRAFREKPPGDSTWINGGFFVLSPKVIDYIDGDQMPWEQAPLQRLAAEGELMAYRHSGFWQPMDTLRDKTHLEDLWRDGSAPWKKW
jgi:glucose-1-phosphate cytidylyltransferase